MAASHTLLPFGRREEEQQSEHRCHPSEHVGFQRPSSPVLLCSSMPSSPTSSVYRDLASSTDKLLIEDTAPLMDGSLMIQKHQNMGTGSRWIHPASLAIQTPQASQGPSGSEHDSAKQDGPPLITQSAEGSIDHLWDKRDLRQEKLRSAHERLQTLRSTSLRKRIKAQESRNQLRQDREEAAGRKADLLKALNALFALNMTGEMRQLTALYDKCRDAMDQYQSQEDSYNTLENEVDEDEYLLSEAEEKFYDRYLRSAVDENKVPLDYASSTSPSAPSEQAIEHPSIITEWLARRAEAEMVHERIDELREQRASLVEAERLRKRVGITLRADDQRFLDEFDSEHAGLLGELARIEIDIEQLARSAVDQGFLIMTADTRTPFDGDDDGDDLMGIDGHYVDENKDSLKLDDPDSPAEKLRLSDLEAFGDVPNRSLSTLVSEKPLDKTLLINHWLLWKLRASQQEILTLKYFIQLKMANSTTSKYPKNSEKQNQNELNDEILRVWREDQAAQKPTVPARTSSAMTVKKDGSRNRNAVSQPDQREKISYLTSYSDNFNLNRSSWQPYLYL